MATWCGPDDQGNAEVWADSFSVREGPVNEHPGPDFPLLRFNGEPVMEGSNGRLVYDCEPESEDGCFVAVPGCEGTEMEAGQ
jgi:hypothetical protein